MSRKPRPPGLDDVARDALKQVAHLAIGLASLPMIGLSLLAARKTGPAPEPASVEPQPSSPAARALCLEAPNEAGPDSVAAADDPLLTTAKPVQPAGGRPAVPPSSREAGPKRADVEAALQTLSQATFAKAPRPRRKGKSKPRNVPSPPL